MKRHPKTVDITAFVDENLTRKNTLSKHLQSVSEISRETANRE